MLCLQGSCDVRLSCCCGLHSVSLQLISDKYFVDSMSPVYSSHCLVRCLSRHVYQLILYSTTRTLHLFAHPVTRHQSNQSRCCHFPQMKSKRLLVCASITLLLLRLSLLNLHRKRDSPRTQQARCAVRDVIPQRNLLLLTR